MARKRGCLVKGRERLRVFHHRLPQWRLLGPNQPGDAGRAEAMLAAAQVFFPSTHRKREDWGPFQGGVLGPIISCVWAGRRALIPFSGFSTFRVFSTFSGFRPSRVSRPSGFDFGFDLRASTFSGFSTFSRFPSGFSTQVFDLLESCFSIFRRFRIVGACRPSFFPCPRFPAVRLATARSSVAAAGLFPQRSLAFIPVCLLGSPGISPAGPRMSIRSPRSGGNRSAAHLCGPGRCRSTAGRLPPGFAGRFGH